MVYISLLLILNSIAGILLLKSQQELIKNRKIALIALNAKKRH